MPTKRSNVLQYLTLISQYIQVCLKKSVTHKILLRHNLIETFPTMSTKTVRKEVCIN